MAKIVFIGGGSVSWTPQFLRDIFITPGLQGREHAIWLQDLDRDALNLMADLGRRMITELQQDFNLQVTSSLDEALNGADYVILTITTGGFDTMRNDLSIPAKYGIRHSVGDTVGPGGLSRALRNIPVVEAIAKRMEIQCPEAWLLNYTNPMSTLCRVVNRNTSIRCIGHCHEYMGVRARLKEIFSLKSEESIHAEVGGINHLAWITACSVEGADLFPRLAEYSEMILAKRGKMDLNDVSSFDDHFAVKAQLFRLFCALPAAGDRHVAEFFPGFICEASRWGLDYDIKLTTINERRSHREMEESLVRSVLAGSTPLAPYFQETSGEAVAPLLDAVTNGKSYNGIVNLPNSGQIPGLPEGATVETFAAINQLETTPHTVDTLPKAVLPILSRHVTNQEMTVEAALTGDRTLTRQVLANDPFVTDLSNVELMLEEMLEANRAYLPRFFE